MFPFSLSSLSIIQCGLPLSVAFVVEAFGVGRLSDQRSNANERGCGNHFFAPECWQLIYCAAQLVATKD